jgi:type II secretory pathway component PulK
MQPEQLWRAAISISIGMHQIMAVVERMPLGGDWHTMDAIQTAYRH